MSPIVRPANVYDSNDEQDPVPVPTESRAEAKKRSKHEQKSPTGIFFVVFVFFSSKTSVEDSEKCFSESSTEVFENKLLYHCFFSQTSLLDSENIILPRTFTNGLLYLLCSVVSRQEADPKRKASPS